MNLVSTRDISKELGFTVQEVAKMVKSCNTLARYMAENNGKSDGMIIMVYDSNSIQIARCEEKNGIATVFIGNGK